MVKPLQPLPPPSLEPELQQPAPARQFSVGALRRPFARLFGSRLVSPPYLTAASGLVFASVVLAQVTLPRGTPPSNRPSQTATFQDSLWQTTGVVRQSIVGLYRAQRVLQPQAEAAAPAEATTSAQPAATPAAAAAPAAPAMTAAAPATPPVPTQRTTVKPGSTIDANLEMRVAIARNVSSLNVGTSTAGYLMDLNGQNFCNLPAQTSYVARPTGQGIDFGNCQLGPAVWLEPSDGGFSYIGDSWFKGRVLLLNDGGNLIAVNYVLLHDYLSSVVGSEMFVNWPIEALKAQAVAARSYALTHHVRPASRHFDLDNTQRFQAYLGIAKETNTTQIAVAETSGEFISYNGGIVESLYAASDQIVQEAHGGQGMSQTGAMQLASQGYNYTQILANYYPGTGLSRLVVE
jgi:stage II sporulation protein D